MAKKITGTTGFSAGSSIISIEDLSVQEDLAYYTIQDAATGAEFLIAIRT